jgi:hypothetical protein
MAGGVTKYVSQGLETLQKSRGWKVGLKLLFAVNFDENRFQKRFNFWIV